MDETQYRDIMSKLDTTIAGINELIELKQELIDGMDRLLEQAG